MDRISSTVEPELTNAEARHSGLRGKVVKVTVSSIPWLIIGGLLWAGLFIKPKPEGGTVQPPELERRDHFYGMSPAPDGGVWVAGSGGKILAVDDHPVNRKIVARLLEPFGCRLSFAEDGAEAVALIEPGGGGIVGVQP